jgi:hypothetical protein
MLWARRVIAAPGALRSLVGFSGWILSGLPIGGLRFRNRFLGCWFVGNLGLVLWVVGL